MINYTKWQQDKSQLWSAPLH